MEGGTLLRLGSGDVVLKLGSVLALHGSDVESSDIQNDLIYKVLLSSESNDLLAFEFLIGEIKLHLKVEVLGSDVVDVCGSRVVGSDVSRHQGEAEG